MENTDESKLAPEKRENENYFKSDQCEFNSYPPITAQRHEKEAHFVERPFTCSYCDFCARTGEKLREHREVHGVPSLKQFQCSKCPAQFTNGGNLKDHFNSHAGQKPYKCKFCHYKTSCRPNLAAHMLRHDSNKQLSCSKCRYVTHVKQKLKRHVLVHHSEAPFIHCTETGCEYKAKDKHYVTTHINSVHRKDVHYRCQFCAKGFYDKGSFESHFRTHTGERPFKCDLCSYSSGKETTLKAHQKVHSTAHNVQCPTCQKVLRDKYAIKGHLKIHSESKRFPCKICPYRGYTEPNLQSHVKKKHQKKCVIAPSKLKSKKTLRTVPYIKVKMRNVVKKIRSFECTFCDFRTSGFSYYNVHVRRHTGEKPYKCDQCDYSTVQSGKLRDHKQQNHTKQELPYLTCRYCEFQTKLKCSLRRHERGHFPAANKIYKCNQCSFASDNTSNLKVHLRTHSGERPFPCSLCSYRGPTKYCFESHLAVHSDEKPLKCPLCDYRAKTKVQIRQHQLSRHQSSGRQKNFVCKVQGCNSSYRVAAKFRDHVRSKHNKETRFKCPLCSKTFFQNYELTCHLRRHMGEKSHKCDVCSYTAASSAEVTRHKTRLHFPSREFSCSECDRTFKGKASLNRHLEFHSTERKHPCPFCAYRAHSKHILKPHLERCSRRWRSKYEHFANKNVNNSCVGAISKQTERLLFVKFGCKPCTVRAVRLEMTRNVRLEM